MPKKYSEQEKENIRKTLRREACECLRIYGVRRTTVDELVHRADIPKGTFYLFYPHKEALFYDVIHTFINDIEPMYLSLLQELDENHIVTSLTDVFYRILMRVYDEGLFRFLDGAELDLVFRKYGEAENIELEKTFSGAIKHLFSFFYIEDENDIAAFSEGYKALMYLLLSADRLDGKEKTLRYLIRGLVLQMVE